ncbi:MAG: hypothetical protein NT150_00985 [Bacteroidetes bacterium]|nr:hypothetical protein [Bacteroidota bacterium]
MFSKIGFAKIIAGHIKTLKNFRTQKTSFWDILGFYVLPCAISYLMVKFDFKINDSVISAFIAAMSIFAGFLFNLLAIVYGFMDKIKANTNQQAEDKFSALKKIYVDEIHSNITYNILISVLSIIPLIGLFSSDFVILLLSKYAAFFFVSHFLLTLLMILKRVYILLNKG